jgi:hypothetical protein
MTGSSDFFVKVKAPRLALGVNKRGQILLLQFDGDENVRGYGADLKQMAKYFIKYGDILHAVNLDGGSSDSVMIQGVTVNSPMEPCHNHPAPSPYCQRSVTTILCFRKPRDAIPSSPISQQVLSVPADVQVAAAEDIRDVYYLLPRIGLFCVLTVAVLAYVIAKTRSNQLNDVRGSIIYFSTQSFLSLAVSSIPAQNHNFRRILTCFQVPLQDFSQFGSSSEFDTQEYSQLIFNRKSASSGSAEGEMHQDDDL